MRVDLRARIESVQRNASVRVSNTMSRVHACRASRVEASAQCVRLWRAISVGDCNTYEKGGCNTARDETGGLTGWAREGSCCTRATTRHAACHTTHRSTAWEHHWASFHPHGAVSPLTRSCQPCPALPHPHSCRPTPPPEPHPSAHPLPHPCPPPCPPRPPHSPLAPARGAPPCQR